MKQCNSCNRKGCSVVRGNSRWPKDRKPVHRQSFYGLPCHNYTRPTSFKRQLGEIAIIKNPQGVYDTLQAAELTLA